MLHRTSDLVVVPELSSGIVEVGPDGEAFDEVPKLGEEILRQQAPVRGDTRDVLTDCRVRAADLLLN